MRPPSQPIRAAAILALLLFIPFAPAFAQCGNSTYTADTFPIGIYVTPEGNGRPMGDVAVIHVTLLDAVGEPIANHPASHLRFVVEAEGTYACTDFIADGPTDANGHTTVSGTFAGGGWSLDGLELWATGEILTWAELVGCMPVPIHFNSPDINGDGRVNLADVGTFGVDLMGGEYHFRSDYDHDGSLSIADLGIMGIHFGEGCDP